MTTRSQRFKLGVFLAIAATLLAVALAFFGGLRLMAPRDTYFAFFSESVFGLETGAPVTLQGVRVGSVTRIEVAPRDIEHVRVTLAIDRPVPLRRDCAATLVYQGITGLKQIDIRDCTREAEPLPPGGVLLTRRSALARLADESDELVDKVELLLDNLLVITRADNARRIDEALQGAADAMARFDQVSEELIALTAQTREVVDAGGEAIQRSLEGVDRTVAEIGGAADRIEQVLGGADELVGDARRILRQNEGELRTTMGNLRQAAQNLSELSRTLRNQPSLLLRSDPPPERRLP